MGPGYRVASDGKTLVSADGSRVYRPPTEKRNTPAHLAPTGTQANFVVLQNGSVVSNGHLNIGGGPVKEVLYNNPIDAAYDEPTEGPRARVRLSGPATNPVVYPGTACDRGLFPGAGKPGGPRLGGGYSARDLGMPKIDRQSKPLEIYVRASEPVTMQFSAGGSGAYLCPPAPPGYRMICPQPKAVVPPCTRTHSFVPAAGKDYEMVFIYVNDRFCDVEVFAIEKDPAGGYRQQRVPSQTAEKCAAPEPSKSINP